MIGAGSSSSMESYFANFLLCFHEVSLEEIEGEGQTGSIIEEKTMAGTPFRAARFLFHSRSLSLLFFWWPIKLREKKLRDIRVNRGLLRSILYKAHPARPATLRDNRSQAQTRPATVLNEPIPRTKPSFDISTYICTCLTSTILEIITEDFSHNLLQFLN